MSTKNDTLTYCAENGNLKKVKFLVENGADVRVCDDYALRAASRNGHLEIIKFLIENGANIHARDDFALRVASNNGQLETVKFLVENGANVHAQDDLALRWASSNGHLETVKYLKSVTKNKSKKQPLQKNNIGWLVTSSNLYAIGEIGVVYETRKMARQAKKFGDKEKIIKVTY